MFANDLIQRDSPRPPSHATAVYDADFNITNTAYICPFPQRMKHDNRQRSDIQRNITCFHVTD